MKVALLINSLCLGGAEKVAIELAEGFRECADEVHIIVLEPETYYKVHHDIKVYNVCRVPGSAPSAIKLLMICFYAIKVWWYLQKHKIGFIQTHSTRAHYVGSIISYFTNRQFHQVLHCMPSLYASEGFSGQLNLFLLSLFSKIPNKILGVSHGVIDEYSDYTGRIEGLHVVNNPHNILKIRELLDVDCPQQLPRKFIVCIGRMVSLKRYDLAIDALIEINKSISEVKLVFLGDGPKMSELQQYACDLGVADDVLFLGKVDNPYPILSRADITLVCSETEGCPNSIVESFACGTPVISTKCSQGVVDLLAVHNEKYKSDFFVGDCGLMVDVGDVRAMAEAAIYLISNSEVSDEFERKGKQRAFEFDIGKVVKEHRLLWE